MGKGLRNKRMRDFNAYVLDGLRMRHRIEIGKNENYIIHTQDFGVLDLYPKSDKLLFREDNGWIDNGIDWVCNNL